MPTDRERCERYFLNPQDPPQRQVLRNVAGLTTAEGLRCYEYASALGRQRQIERGDVEIPQTHDAAQLRALHRHLFQDVYEWAGEYRTVGLSKGKPFTPPEAIDAWLSEASSLVAATSWPTMGCQDFARASATVYAR